MKKLIACMAVVAVLFSSCAFMEGLLGEDKVLTTSGKVIEGREGEGVNVDPSKLPEAVRKFFEENYPGEDVVLISSDAVKEGAERIPVTQEKWGIWESLFTLAMKFGGDAWPPLLAIEGMGLAFFRRKRNHYKSALKAILPMNGKVEVVSAFGSVGKALGLSHSSKKTKKVFEAEKPVT